jgi:hypothetical protein
MILDKVMERLEIERSRVRQAINDWRMGINLKPTKEKKERKPGKTSKAKAVLNEYEQVQAMLKNLGGTAL